MFSDGVIVKSRVMQCPRKPRLSVIQQLVMAVRTMCEVCIAAQVHTERCMNWCLIHADVIRCQLVYFLCEMVSDSEI